MIAQAMMPTDLIKAIPIMARDRVENVFNSQ
jgi:hypothetical protein